MTVKGHQFTIDGQKCYFHDESDNNITSGHFHTYDEFCVSSNHPPRKLHIFIPIDYLTNNNQKRYPVIYMNDGQTSFWKGGIANKTWNVSHYDNESC